MNISFKKDFLKHKKIIILIGLIVLTTGSILFWVYISAETSSDCIGTDANTQHCCTCLAIDASPTLINEGDSSTLTLYVDNNPDHDSDICSCNGFSAGDGTAVCSIDNGVRSNATFNDGSYDYSVLPSDTITYTATCSGIGGVKTASVTITVIQNQLPRVESSEIEYEQYCDILTGQGLIGFKWIYQDDDNDNESRFDFRVNNINNVNDLNPEIDRTFDGLNNPSGSANTQSVLVKSPPEADKISFNETYHWWSRVWDSKGANSGWIAGPSITTDSHAWPDCNFAWSPSSPSIDEVVQLCSVQTGVCGTNESTCYNSSNNPISCSGKTFLWTLPSEAEFATTSAASTENPQIKFTDSGNYTVTLKITDDVGACSQSHQIRATLPLPEWIETTP